MRMRGRGLRSEELLLFRARRSGARLVSAYYLPVERLQDIECFLSRLLVLCNKPFSVEPALVAVLPARAGKVIEDPRGQPFHVRQSADDAYLGLVDTFHVLLGELL